MSGPLFGVVPIGLPLIAEPASTPSPTSFLYALPADRPFTQVMVFLLPNISLPPNTAAAVYISTAADISSGEPNFKFLGGIGPGKESAVFKLPNPSSSSSELVVGIDIEPEETVGQHLQELATSEANSPQPPAGVLAQRIIQNAFNFLSGFAGTAGPDGVEVVPLKAFEGWWKKFEQRVRADSSFLNKPQD